MDLVDHQCGVSTHEAHRVVQGETSVLFVVERGEGTGVRLRDPSREGRLPRLPRSDDGDDAGVTQCPTNLGFGVAEYQGVFACEGFPLALPG